MERRRVRRIAESCGARVWLPALLSLTACNPFVVRYRPDAAVQHHADGETMPSQWNGTLASSTGRSGATPLTGAVAATPGLDGLHTYVHVSLTGAAPGAAYPWQLREGGCDARGAVVGDAGAYSALLVNDEGRAASAATVSVRLAPGARYHVRLGASVTDTAAVVACGDLTPPTR